MEITFYGTRGSTPISGRDYIYYGGNTTCIALEVEGNLIVIDCGSGMQRLWMDKFETASYQKAVFLMTHFHWDHVQGIPFFSSFFQKECSFSFYGEDRIGITVKEQIEQIMRSPMFPIGLDDFQAKLDYHAVKCGESFQVYGVKIDTIRLAHPDICTGYRLTYQGRSICIIADCETTTKETEKFAYGADMIIYDAQYTKDEYEKKLGWGHSTWEEGCLFAKKCKAGRLVLTHHDPLRTDRELDELQRKATGMFQNAIFAYDSMKVKF